METIAELTQQVVMDNHVEWERRMALVIKPKPKWLPVFVHRYLLKLLLEQTIKSGWRQ
jgi:hypothetical protein